MTQSRSESPLIFVGIASCVVALDKEDGQVAWSTRLPSTGALVTLMHDGPHVFAISNGEISCLSAATGKFVWHNTLKGFGRGFAILAGGGGDDVTNSQAIQQQQAASDSAATTAATMMMTSSAMHST